MNKVKATLIIIAIILMAACSPTPQAIKRESARPIQGEIIEGRSVIVNVPGRNGYTFVMEV